METINLVIHHGGSWSDTENMVYSGGKVERLDNFDIDYLSFHELQWHYRNWGYENACRIWYRLWGINGGEVVEEITDDKDLKLMIANNEGYDDIQLYVVEISPPYC